MTKRMKNFRIDEDLLAGLESIRQRLGIPASEQVRRGILLWIQDVDRLVPRSQKKTPRPRGHARKRG